MDAARLREPDLPEHDLHGRVRRALSRALDEGVLQPAEVLELLAAREAAPALRPDLIRFDVLGRFEVSLAGRTVPDSAWHRPLAARLVRFLLVQEGRAVPEDEIFAAFWPDMPAAAARQNLRVAARHARAALDPGDAGQSLLERRDRTWRLRLDEDVQIDAAEFEAAATAALASEGPARRRLLEHAAGAWRGEPMPEERYSDWATLWRERLIDRHVEVLGALTDACAAAGDHPGMLRAARACVEAEPCNEAAQRALMVAYARAGLRGHALRQYRDCRRVLVHELGVEPDFVTARLHQRVLAGEAV